jgi:hypothetical protein
MMHIRIQLIIESDSGTPELVQDVAHLQREELRPDTLGLTLGEAKALLAGVQRAMVTQQTEAYLAQHATCAQCGKHCHRKGTRPIVYRTLFGTLRLPNERLFHCPCQPHSTQTFSPLADLLPERTAPERLYFEAKFASLMSYGLTIKLLEEILPLDGLNTTSVRHHLQAVAQRCEDELGDEQTMFVEGCERDWEELPRPDLPLTVGIDGGYVHSCEQPTRREGWFEVIVGKSITAEGTAKCFGFVQGCDQKPKRRLFELLTSQGMQMNQQVTFLSDGGETVRELQLYLNPNAEHLLDWFHLTMRLTVLQQTAKGLPQRIDAGDGEEPYALREPVMKGLERTKWYLWHGNVFRALQEIESIIMDLDAAGAEATDATVRKLLKTGEEFQTYIEKNTGFIPNYGERWRYGERISTGFVESTVNQVISKRMVKKQQMRWSPRGAHLLLQVRTRVLNEELRSTFGRWYVGFDTSSRNQEEPQAA